MWQGNCQYEMPGTVFPYRFRCRWFDRDYLILQLKKNVKERPLADIPEVGIVEPQEKKRAYW